ncbi:hypothetical protein MXB_4562, partial [Myxobolus squamalis]
MSQREHSPSSRISGFQSRFSNKSTNYERRRHSRERSRSRDKNVLSNRENRNGKHKEDRIRPVADDESAGYKVKRVQEEPKRSRLTNPSKKLYITNLSRNVQNKHLKEIFGGFGDLISAEVSCYEDFQVSNSFGHIIYKDIDSAQKAMKNMNGGQID